MPGTVNWGTATVVGVFAGMLYGGSKEASASVVSVSSYNIVQFQKHISCLWELEAVYPTGCSIFFP